MVNILFKKKNNNIFFFEVIGHANQSSYGNDIVCSAISSTTLMTLNALIEILKLEFKYKIDEGYTMCNVENINNDKVYFIIKAYYIFIEELAKQYPKNLKFKVMEV